jgi:hypothetical protein
MGAARRPGIKTLDDFEFDVWNLDTYHVNVYKFTFHPEQPGEFDLELRVLYWDPWRPLEYEFGKGREEVPFLCEELGITQTDLMNWMVANYRR